MDEEAIDFVGLTDYVPAPEALAAPADPWLARRTLAWGASDVPVVLVITGRRPIESLPKWAQPRARKTNRTRGFARAIAEKAGIVAPLRAGPAAAVGTAREVELLDAWAAEIERGAYALPIEEAIDPSTIDHASSVPREWMPLRARQCSTLAATPDAWCRTHGGSLLDVEVKCPTSDVSELRWTWRVQVQAQGMATGSKGAIVVAGSRWGREESRRDDGPIVRAYVEPDPALRAEIAEACAEAWASVEALKASLGV